MLPGVASRGGGRPSPPRPKCPLGALKSATKPVEITHVALDDGAKNLKTLQALTDTFNSSQSDVKVKLLNQVD